MSISINTKKPWTVEEDSLLTRLVEAHGTINWSGLAELLPDRSGKQCRERWHNHLNPDIKKGDWSETEDQLILCMQRQMGNQWAKIAKHLPGRSDNAIKNRFHAIIRARASQVPIAVNDVHFTSSYDPMSIAALPTVNASPLVSVALPKVAQVQPKLVVKEQPSPSTTQSNTSVFGNFNPISFMESANQYFSTSGWTFSFPEKASTSPEEAMIHTPSSSSGKVLQHKYSDVSFDQFVDGKSDSPMPCIDMSLSPVPIDEEFLDYWGLTTSTEDNKMKFAAGNMDSSLLDDVDIMMSCDDDMIVDPMRKDLYEFGF